MTEIVVTGRGVVSPLGSSTEKFLAGLASNEVATQPSPWLNEETGRPIGWWSGVRDFEPSQWMDPTIEAGSDLFTQFALAAAQQAVDESGIESLDPLRTAVVHGTSMGGMRALLRAQHDLEQRGSSAVDRKTMIKIWPNMAAAQIAMRWQLHGPSLTVCTACASSLDAIGMAVALLKSGRADVAVVGGTEGGMTLADGTADGTFVPATLYGQAAYGMSHDREPDRLRASLPFDRNRSGIVTAEGSAFLLLETADHATARGAHVLGVVAGYGSVSDSYHPSSPEPSGQWESLAMREALRDARISAADVDFLIAHATATPKGDTAEINAINTVLARSDRALPVASLKGHLGHTGASSGAMNTIAALNVFGQGWMPNTAGTTDVDSACRFDVVIEKPLELHAQVAQVNSFGFGGQNASLVVTRAS